MGNEARQTGDRQMTTLAQTLSFGKADAAWLDMVNEVFGEDAPDAIQDVRSEGEEGTPLRAAFEARQAALNSL
jgi:hypothetical protein